MWLKMSKMLYWPDHARVFLPQIGSVQKVYPQISKDKLQQQSQRKNVCLPARVWALYSPSRTLSFSPTAPARPPAPFSLPLSCSPSPSDNRAAHTSPPPTTPPLPLPFVKTISAGRERGGKKWPIMQCHRRACFPLLSVRVCAHMNICMCAFLYDIICTWAGTFVGFLASVWWMSSLDTRCWKIVNFLLRRSHGKFSFCQWLLLIRCIDLSIVGSVGSAPTLSILPNSSSTPPPLCTHTYSSRWPPHWPQSFD